MTDPASKIVHFVLKCLLKFCIKIGPMPGGPNRWKPRPQPQPVITSKNKAAGGAGPGRGFRRDLHGEGAGGRGGAGKLAANKKFV